MFLEWICIPLIPSQFYIFPKTHSSLVILSILHIYISIHPFYRAGIYIQALAGNSALLLSSSWDTCKCNNGNSRGYKSGKLLPAKSGCL